MVRPIVSISWIGEGSTGEIFPFPTTYLCEKAFSTMLQVKTKARNRLQGGLLNDMRVALAKTKPEFNKLVAQRQQQKSH